MTKENKLLIILRGIIMENPVLILVLGTCPTLATTTSVISALSMGVAATIVLVCSNAVISALRKVIPDKVRLPAFIVIIESTISTTTIAMHRATNRTYFRVSASSIHWNALEYL